MNYLSKREHFTNFIHQLQDEICSSLEKLDGKAKFEEDKEVALAKGFRHVASGPLVRSSYHAADFRPELDLIEDIEKEAAAK